MIGVVSGPMLKKLLSPVAATAASLPVLPILPILGLPGREELGKLGRRAHVAPHLAQGGATFTLNIVVVVYTFVVVVVVIVVVFFHELSGKTGLLPRDYHLS